MSFTEREETAMKKLICSAALATLACGFAAPASADECFRTCGTLSPSTDLPNTVVTAPPSPYGPDYQYVSTYQGLYYQDNPASLGVGGENNGSLYVSDSFSASPGEILQFYFNYVTTDTNAVPGSVYTYPDYAWAALRPTDGGADILLFTARTAQGIDNTVPGFDMPGLADGVTLTPTSTPIISAGGEPIFWNALGTIDDPSVNPDGSHNVYGGVNGGAGYTGWIGLDYTIADAGMYQLVFGVTNVTDDMFDSGLAFAGMTIDGRPLDGGEAAVPEPATMLLFGAGLLGLAGMRKKPKS
jgi:hypothetical protein